MYTQDRCPKCSSGRIRHTSHATGKESKVWKCDACGAVFQKPVEGKIYQFRRDHAYL